MAVANDFVFCWYSNKYQQSFVFIIDTIADNEVCSALEQVAQELAGNGVLVEVERA